MVIDIIKATVVMPCLISSNRISHFGINPVVGGRPPKATKIIRIIAIIIGFFTQEIDSWLMLWADRISSARNIEVVKIK